MTDRSRQAWVLGLAAAVLAGLTVPALLGAADAAWDSKVSRSRYELDRQRDSITYLRDRRADSLANAELKVLVLEVLCSPLIDPSDRRCPRHE